MVVVEVLAARVDVSVGDTIGVLAGVQCQCEGGTFRVGEQRARLETPELGELVRFDPELLRVGDCVRLAVATTGRCAGDVGDELDESALRYGSAFSIPFDRTDWSIDQPMPTSMPIPSSLVK